MGHILNTSMTILMLKYLYSRYCRVTAAIAGGCKNSMTHKLIERLRRGAKICFKYSFVSRLTEIKKIDGVLILKSSRFARRLDILSRAWKFRLADYKIMGRQLCFPLVQKCCLVFVSAILVNLFLLLLYNKPVKIFDWSMRAGFLFLGISGLFSEADWEEVKKESMLLWMIRNH